MNPVVSHMRCVLDNCRIVRFLWIFDDNPHRWFKHGLSGKGCQGGHTKLSDCAFSISVALSLITEALTDEECSIFRAFDVRRNVIFLSSVSARTAVTILLSIDVPQWNYVAGLTVESLAKILHINDQEVCRRMKFVIESTDEAI